MTSIQCRFFAVLAATAVAFGPALGAHTASAQAPPPAPSALPKADCGEKPEWPGRLASDKNKLQWRKDAQVYVECYRKWATERRDLAMQLAQQYQEAANAGIAEYNAVVKEVQAVVEAAGKE